MAAVSLIELARCYLIGFVLFVGWRAQHHALAQWRPLGVAEHCLGVFGAAMWILGIFLIRNWR